MMEQTSCGQSWNHHQKELLRTTQGARRGIVSYKFELEQRGLTQLLSFNVVYMLVGVGVDVYLRN